MCPDLFGSFNETGRSLEGGGGSDVLFDHMELELDDIVRSMLINPSQYLFGFVILSAEDEHSGGLWEFVHEANLHNRRNNTKTD